MNMNDTGEFDNGLLMFMDPLDGYEPDVIRKLPEPTLVELEFWRSGERYKSIRMYMKRNELTDVNLVSWYFLSMTYVANQILREKKQQMPELDF